MSTITKPCPSCRRTLIGRVLVARGGHLAEEWPRCICEIGAPAVQLQPDEHPYEERAAAARKTGICMDCDQPVGGRRGSALRCAAHKRAAKTQQEREYRKTPKGRKKQRRFDARRRKGDRGERRRARRRELHAQRMATDPEYAAKYRKRRQRETLLSNPGREKYLETQRRHNADPVRAQRKRDHALAKYYEEHPERPRPVCATCGDPIEWKPGHGRPPKYHQTPECNRWVRARAGRKAA